MEEIYQELKKCKNKEQELNVLRSIYERQELRIKELEEALKPITDEFEAMANIQGSDNWTEREFVVWNNAKKALNTNS